MTIMHGNYLSRKSAKKMDAQLRSRRERDETFAKQIADMAKKDN